MVTRDIVLLETAPGIKQLITKVLKYYDERDRDCVRPNGFYWVIIEEFLAKYKEQLDKITPKQKGLFDEETKEDSI